MTTGGPSATGVRLAACAFATWSCAASKTDAAPDAGAADAGADVVHHAGENNDWSCLGNVVHPPKPTGTVRAELTFASAVQLLT